MEEMQWFSCLPQSKEGEGLGTCEDPGSYS